MITFPPASETSPSLPDFSISTTITHEIDVGLPRDDGGLVCRLTILPDGSVGLAFEYYGDHAEALERREITVFGLLDGRPTGNRVATLHERFITPENFRNVLHALTTLASTLPDDPE